MTVKKSKAVCFVIANPDVRSAAFFSASPSFAESIQANRVLCTYFRCGQVYKSPGNESYVVFGEAKIEDLGAQVLF